MKHKRYPYQGRKKEPSVLPLDPETLSAIGVAIHGTHEVVQERQNRRDIETLSEKTEKLVQEFADYAIEKSETYHQAIAFVHMNASLTVHGQAIKKAIQDEITNRALNSKID